MPQSRLWWWLYLLGFTYSILTGKSVILNTQKRKPRFYCLKTKENLTISYNDAYQSIKLTDSFISDGTSLSKVDLFEWNRMLNVKEITAGVR